MKLKMNAFKCFRVTTFYANQTCPKVGGTDRCARTHVHMHTRTQSSYFQSIHVPFQEEKQAKDKDFTSNSHMYTSCNMTDGDKWHTTISPIYSSISVFRHYLHSICALPNTSQGALNPETYAAGLLWTQTQQAADTHQSLLASQRNSEDMNLQHCCEKLKLCTYWKTWQQTNITIITLAWQVLVPA